ncbi:MAG TPA: alpha-2-macroglobulin family protein, partial [Candidatus Deferrimicrobium sp.]
LYQRTVSSHRKRIIGGFYAFEHVRQVRRVGALCAGKTDGKGLLFCEAKSPVSGNVILQAEATDAAGNAASPARRDIWVAEKDDWWFDVSDSDRIDVLPERKRYEPGETAKLQVRMPFREATALVTVEREGIADVFVRKLSGKEPVVEIPVKNYYAPNAFVSVLCVRGRVGEAQPTALVDLGKPAFKLGIAEIRVGWKAHELAVSVTPGKSVYQVRDKATVRIKAARAAGGAVPKGTEVAVAAVDEGLLELMPNRSWDLLSAMMAPRGYEVKTATAQMQVVGKRHFGLKALPAGGGGGKQITRKLFDTLLLWKGRVALDNNGEATVEIPLNDSLTSFKVAAVASGGAEFFGTGYAAFRTTQDLQLLPGLPPLVREGDRFRAAVTVRNSTDRAMTVSVVATETPVEDPESAAFRAGAAHAPRTLPEWSGRLEPGEAREIGWETDVPAGLEALKWEIAAKEKGGNAADRLQARQKVVAATPVRVFQATITQVDGSFRLDVERPRDAVPGKGGVSVAFRPKLASGLGGVAAFMKRYPYVCLEQKTSRAVALRDAAMWKGIMADLPASLDSDGLAKYFPKMRRGCDTLTAYILSIADEAGWEIPPGPREEMESALVKFVAGKIRRDSFLSTKDHSIRKIAALEALSRRGKANPKLLSSIAIEPNLWPTSAVIDWLNVLSRVKEIPDRDKRLKEAEQIVRSRLNFQGTMMGFSTEKEDYWWWLMVSGDYNAVRAVLTFLNFDSWNEDMPRLVRGALGRQHGGRWSTTTANAWGVLAMEKFSRKFESVPVTGGTDAALGDKVRPVDWAKSPGGAAAAFVWPKGKGTLSLTHRGTGKPWATVQSLAAIPLKEPFSSGYKIKKTVTPVDRKRNGAWSRGDVVRVRLELESQADRTWVVVSDPVPAGATILGSGLGRDSTLLAQGEAKGEWWTWPAFEERSFEAFRSYFEYVPKGKWTVEYTVRLNNPGTFLLPATRVEALYSPEMFGELPNGP